MEENQDRRAHPRFHLGECGYLEPIATNAARGKQEVYVANISRGGLGLHLDREIPAGTAVRVTLSRCTIEGHVAHCRLNDSGYVAGIKALKEISRADQLHHEKQHLSAPPPAPPEVVTTERVTFLGIRVRRRQRA